MPQRKLDRSRPFSEIYGEASHRYEQDGLKFDQHDNEVTADGKPVVSKDAPVADSDGGKAGGQPVAKPLAHMKNVELFALYESLSGGPLPEGTKRADLIAAIERVQSEKNPAAA